MEHFVIIGDEQGMRSASKQQQAEPTIGGKAKKRPPGQKPRGFYLFRVISIRPVLWQVRQAFRVSIPDAAAAVQVLDINAGLFFAMVQGPSDGSLFIYEFFRYNGLIGNRVYNMDEIPLSCYKPFGMHTTFLLCEGPWVNPRGFFLFVK